MRRTIAKLTLIAAVVVAGGCLLIVDPNASLTIHNHSSFVIHEVRLRSVDDSFWGPNLLSADLQPGDDARVGDFFCGHYAVQVVDVHGQACMVPNLDMCVLDRPFVLDDFMLSACGFAS